MERTNAQILEALRRYRESTENGIVVFYGDPYIDQSAILAALVRDRYAFSYAAQCVSDREQRRLFLSRLKGMGVSFTEPEDQIGWNTLLHRLTDSLPAGEKLLLLFDRFEHFFYEDSGFLHALTDLVREPSLSGRLLILLISGAEVWVENSFVERAGRDASAISSFVKCRENRYSELRKHFPELSARDAAQLYAVFGGETILWEFYDRTLDLKENLCRLFLTNVSPNLRELPMARLKDIVREPAVYSTILANLADGREKLGDLYHATGIPRAKLSVYIRTLMAPSFVEKVFSFGTVGSALTKKGTYRIRNAFFRFYYTAIYPNESILRAVGADKFYDLYLTPALTEVTAVQFKRICMEYIEQLDEQGRLPFVIEEEGEWNGKAGSIDIVAESDTGETLVGMCSYRNILTEDDYHFLLTYAKQAGLSPDHCYLFSGQGFSRELTLAARNVAGLHLIGWKELEHV